MPPARKRATRKAEDEASAQQAELSEDTEDTVAEDEQVEEQQVAAEAAPQGADPEPAGDPQAGEPVDAEGEELPQSVLLAKAEDLLGAAPEVVRGVLAEAPDPISIRDARERIEQFLQSPVPTSETKE